MTVFSHLSNAEFVRQFDTTFDVLLKYTNQSEIVAEAIRRLRESADVSDAVDKLGFTSSDLTTLADKLEQYGIENVDEALETQRIVDDSSYSVKEAIRFAELGDVVNACGVKTRQDAVSCGAMWFTLVNNGIDSNHKLHHLIAQAKDAGIMTAKGLTKEIEE